MFSEYGEWWWIWQQIIIFLLEYEKAAKKIKDQGLILAKVDATVHPTLAKQFNIEGFPTLMLFRKGEHVENYSGERKADAIATVNDSSEFRYLTKALGLQGMTVKSII